MSEIALERATATLPARTLSMRSLKWALTAGLAGLLVLGAARYAHEWWSVGRFLETTDDAYVGGNVTPISPHVAGFVAQILVADNDHVSAGQMLIKLDDRDFRAAVDRATAIVAQRQATLASLTARELLQQSTIRAAEADVDAKTAEAVFTTRGGRPLPATRANKRRLAAECAKGLGLERGRAIGRPLLQGGA